MNIESNSDPLFKRKKNISITIQLLPEMREQYDITKSAATTKSTTSSRFMPIIKSNLLLPYVCIDDTASIKISNHPKTERHNQSSKVKFASRDKSAKASSRKSKVSASQRKASVMKEEEEREKFSFDINLYRKGSDKLLSSSKLKALLEEKRTSCFIKKRFSKVKKHGKLSKLKIFPLLEKLIENSILHFKKYDLLEGSSSFAEKVVLELKKNNKDLDKLTALLENLPGFKKFMTIMGISHKVLYQSSEKLGYRLLQEGEYLFREGDKSDNFYCIISGKIELSKTKKIEKERLSFINNNILITCFSRSTSNFLFNPKRGAANIQKEVRIDQFDDPFTTLKDGEVFGEYGLIDDKDRRANAKAVVDTHLIVVDYQCFKQFYKASIEKVLIDRKLFLLNHFPYFTTFSKDEFQKIFLKMVIRPIEKGKLIIEEGNTADTIYIILKAGVCKLTKRYLGEEINILTLLEGDLFGLEAASAVNYSEMLRKKQINNDNLVSTEEVETNAPPIVFEKYKYSVLSDSNDTIVIQLNLMQAEIIKKEFYIFLQELNSKKIGIINNIYNKNIEQRIKYKPTYAKDEINRKINPHLISKFLESKSQKEEINRLKATTTHKSNLTLKVISNTSNFNHLIPESNKYKSTTDRLIEVTNKKDENIRIPNIAYSSLNTCKITINSNLLNNNENQISVFSHQESLTNKKISTKNISHVEAKSSNSIITDKGDSKLYKDKDNQTNRMNTYSTVKMKGNSISVKNEIKQIVAKDNKRKINLFRTDNFNIPLISELLK